MKSHPLKGQNECYKKEKTEKTSKVKGRYYSIRERRRQIHIDELTKEKRKCIMHSQKNRISEIVREYCSGCKID